MSVGFRLHRFEVYNWGTFHDRIWSIEPTSENTLVTGDIGSGKSTLIDALTTLLVAPQKIAYNRAAGAELRERTLRSYVAGHYKAERGDAGLSAKPVALRDRNAYSVVLGQFYAEEIDQFVTLAQVFWQREAQGQPERLYTIADGSLSIGEHFSRFGGEVRELRRRLRAVGAELHESFSAYGAAYRRRLGIGNEQAMDLFHQTVSMKSVGNLTEFVREHMLEGFDVEPRIRALVAHFDDLKRAHDAVLLAKDQIALLEPLAADCDAFTRVTAHQERLRDCREALRPWFAHLKSELLHKRLVVLNAEIDRSGRQIAALGEKRIESEAQREEVRQSIARNGGDRVESIKRDIDRLSVDRGERQRRSAKYDELAGTIGLAPAGDEEEFSANRPALERERSLLDALHDKTQAELTEASVAERDLRHASREIESELESLRLRKSNIPRGMLDLRTRMCRDIACAETELPFIGELLAVRPEERDWEGAAERVLHNFGLSLLVPDAYYAQVADWVDRTHLGGRLVYYRIRAGAMRDERAVRALDMGSLFRKLAIAPDSLFYAWLEAELVNRFNYVCCDALDQFRREPRALTRSGQIKGRGERHEKDDRRSISDRSQYVLGWSNEAKIAALEKQRSDIEKRIDDSLLRLSDVNARRRDEQARRAVVEQLSSFQSFREMDWRPLAADIDRLASERQEIESASDVLRALEEQMVRANEDIKRLEQEQTHRRREESVAQEKHLQATALLAECTVVLDATPEEAQERLFPELASLRSDALGEHVLSVESCDNRERDMRDWIQARFDAEVKRCDRLRDAIVRAMQEYRGRYPTEAQELDATVEAGAAYQRILDRLLSDDLPQFEARFKELLNENAIREVANFQSQLNRELLTTKERIESINRSLHEIDYNPGRYIALEAEHSTDMEVRDFQRDLRACTEGALTGSEEDEYTEAKFLQVKRIIERFRGREGTAELDRRWTRKVTDVRNWQTFSASERWREDDRDHEHYTDSGGKSGGQKEKLAYTILAASLAYQLGLDRASGRSFRFVAIDEAFGRGSDESARYGLDLFKHLNLQLLVVTPLQKIHVIEPFVAHVTYVSSNGRESQLTNLTIEEFRAQRAARAG